MRWMLVAVAAALPYVQTKAYAGHELIASAFPSLRDVRRGTPAWLAFPYADVTFEEGALEVFLLLWDEMDDWLAACRHMLRSIT